VVILIDGTGGTVMTQFYLLLPDEKNGMIFGYKWAYGNHEQPSLVGEAQQCPVCNRMIGPRRWLPPHRISLSKASPKKWGDFLWVSLDLMVSARFMEIYEKEKLTGIVEVDPTAEIIRTGTKKLAEIPAPLPEYHLIHIPWGGANQDDFASGVAYLHPEEVTCQYCRSGSIGQRQEKIMIEDGSWNGADIFWARHAPWHYIVSERFKEVVEVCKLANFWLLPSERFAIDTFPGNTRMGGWYIHE
jgi:hypothetical protein